MSQENVDLVRSIYSDWGRGDFTSVEWAHPDIEFGVADGPAPGSWTGVAAMAAAWREDLGTWEGLRVEVEECRALDADRVLVLLHFSGEAGKASGLESSDVPFRGANLLEVRNGKVISLILYWDRELAFEAVGLRE